MATRRAFPGSELTTTLYSKRVPALRAAILQSASVFRWVALLLLLPFLAAASTRAENAFVRVNQVGYEAGAPSRAYLMSVGAETGAAFEVVDDAGKTAQSGVVGAAVGVWGKFNVYA
jgi:hypothetical protein